MKFVAPLKENCVFSCLALCRDDRVMRRFLLGAALFDDFCCLIFACFFVGNRAASYRDCKNHEKFAKFCFCVAGTAIGRFA